MASQQVIGNSRPLKPTLTPPADAALLLMPATDTKTTIEVADYDLLDIALACHSALAQDTPQPADVYLNQILNLAVAYCTAEMRAEIEEFLAQKKYLPAVDLKIVT